MNQLRTTKDLDSLGEIAGIGYLMEDGKLKYISFCDLDFNINYVELRNRDVERYLYHFLSTTEMIQLYWKSQYLIKKCFETIRTIPNRYIDVYLLNKCITNHCSSLKNKLDLRCLTTGYGNWHEKKLDETVEDVQISSMAIIQHYKQLVKIMENRK